MAECTILKVRSKNQLQNKRLRYVFDFIENHPLSDGRLRIVTDIEANTEMLLNYGENSDGLFYMPADNYLFGENWTEPIKMVAEPYVFGDSLLYSISKSRSGKKQEFFTHGYFGFDIFESIFFHLSRIEEIWFEKAQVDKSVQSDEQDFLMIREELNEIPVVDQIVSAFLQVLGFKVDLRKTDFLLTHDIDKIYKYNQLLDGFKAALWPVVFRKSIMEGLRNLMCFFNVRAGKTGDPYDSYDYLLRDEEFWGEKIIFWMAGGKSNYDLFDKFYEKALPALLSKAKLKGYKAGIHPSYYTGTDQKMLLKEINYLGKVSGEPVLCSRQHWLRFFHHSTPAILEQADIITDHTLGYRTHIGFRCGTGFAYPLYHFGEERAYNFLCQPLIIMDSALMHFCKEDLSKFSFHLFVFLNRNRFNTCITLNFHNSTFDYTFGERRKLIKIYEDMVELVRKFAIQDQIN